jgi:ABC-type branched-subunit amino acid transport system permease subunit
MVGGLGSPYGAVFGALLIRGIPDLVKFNNLWIVPIGSGLLLLVVIVRARVGIAGLSAYIRERGVIGLDKLLTRTPSE